MEEWTEKREKKGGRKRENKAVYTPPKSQTGVQEQM